MDNCPCDKDWRVSIDNIGDAGIHTVSALRKAFNEDASSIAKRILQAPSLLVQNIHRQKAKQIAQLLQDSGLQAKASSMSEPFRHGDSEHEVALHLSDFKCMNQLVNEVMMLTGVDLAQAVRMLCTMPSVLLGNISKENAHALQRRFRKMGVELDISKPLQARFDVFIQTNSYIVLQEIKRISHVLDIEVAENRDAGTVVAADLEYATANRLWELTQEKKIQCRLINRDYQRYNVTLTSSKEAELTSLKAVLMNGCGIPEAAIPVLLHKLPVVISNNMTLRQAQELMLAVKECGAESSADLIACLYFNLKFETYDASEKVHGVLKTIGNVNANAISALDRGRSRILDGPFTYNQAKWLMHELKKLGNRVGMVRT